MFGRDDNTDSQAHTQDTQSTDNSVPSVNGLGASPSATPADNSPADTPLSPSIYSDTSISDDTISSNPPSADPQPATSDDDFSLPTSDDLSTSSDTNDLIDLKSKALQQLTPLVDHLDQSPVEKFRTTMMMIQASDNQSLLAEAYKIAQQIPDDKAKAQALLDIVNEINYFTQHQSEK